MAGGKFICDDRHTPPVVSQNETMCQNDKKYHILNTIVRAFVPLNI